MVLAPSRDGDSKEVWEKIFCLRYWCHLTQVCGKSDLFSITTCQAATKSSNIGKRCWPIILHFRNIHNFVHCNFRNELTPHGVHRTRGEPIPPQHELRITIGNFPEKKKWNESPFNLLASPQVKTPNESESLFLGNGNQLTSTSNIAYQVSTVPKSSLSSFSASATSLTLSRSHRIFRAEKYVEMGRPQRCCMGSNSIPLNSRWVILGRLANDSRPGRRRLLDSEIIIDLKILVGVVLHQLQTANNCADNRLESIVVDNQVKISGRDHDR